MKTNFSLMLCGYILIFIMMTLTSVPGAHGRCYNETRMGRNSTTLQRLTLAANVMASLSSIMKAGYIPTVAQRQKERDFYKLWKLLGALKEEEQRVKSFLVLTEAKGQPQLTAIQVVLEKLVKTACELIGSSHGVRNCTYDKLLQLKLNVDIYNTLELGLATAKKLMTRTGGSSIGTQNRNYWLQDVIACLLSDQEVASLNRLLNWLPWRLTVITKSCCDK